MPETVLDPATPITTRKIDTWLDGQACLTAIRHGELTFTDLHLPTSADTARSVQAEIDAAIRRGLDEVTAGLDAIEAIHQASRNRSRRTAAEYDH